MNEKLIKMVRIIMVAVLFIVICEIYYVSKDVIVYLRRLDLIPKLSEVHGKQ